MAVNTTNLIIIIIIIIIIKNWIELNWIIIIIIIMLHFSIQDHHQLDQNM
jgi:hypothetical protein